MNFLMFTFKGTINCGTYAYLGVGLIVFLSHRSSDSANIRITIRVGVSRYSTMCASKDSFGLFGSFANSSF